MADGTSKTLLSKDMICIKGKGNHMGSAMGKTFIFAPDLFTLGHKSKRSDTDEE